GPLLPSHRRTSAEDPRQRTERKPEDDVEIDSWSTRVEKGASQRSQNPADPRRAGRYQTLPLSLRARHSHPVSINFPPDPLQVGRARIFTRLHPLGLNDRQTKPC